MVKLDISRNQICGLNEKGGGNYDASGLAALAKSIGNLKELNISGNQICGFSKNGGTYDASGLAALAKSIGNLKELNISNNWLKAEGANILAPALEANGSLSELDLSQNDLRSEGLSVVSEALKSTSIKHLNLAENNLWQNKEDDVDMSGVIKFTEDMKDMGSLASLNLAGNYLRFEEGATLLRAAVRLVVVRRGGASVSYF